MISRRTVAQLLASHILPLVVDEDADLPAVATKFNGLSGSIEKILAEESDDEIELLKDFLIPKVRELSEGDGKRLFERYCSRYLNMSAEEFRHAYYGGLIDPDDVHHPAYMQAVMMLPFYESE